MAIQPGDTLGPYEIFAELGRGGMATVFRARQASMGRDVAIKVLPEQFLHDPSFMARFTNEARVIAALEHPRILPVYDFGEAAGVPYIVMRYMAHGSLRDRLRLGPLASADVARITAQTAEALDFAHGRGVVHRDLKPDNVLLDEAGNAYLSDFGIAKVVEVSLISSSTMVVGTPHYMAPEQARGRKPTPRADIYALGAMTFELLAGRPPFHADDAPALMYLHVYEPVPSLAAVNPFVAAGLQPVIEKAMAKTPEARYASAGEFAGALTTTIQGTAGPAGRPILPLLAPTVAEQAPPQPRPPASGLKRLLGAVAVGGGTLLLVGTLAVGAIVWFGVRFFRDLAAAASATEAAQATRAAADLNTPVLAVTPTAPAQIDNAALMFVPAGEFLMGSESGEADERPPHIVYLDDFWIDQTEVTNAAYALCANEGTCEPPDSLTSSTRADYYGDSLFDRYPVIFVSWIDADTFCRWAGRRLPSEAEWEKAAKGVDDLRFPWGFASPGPRLLNYGSTVDDTTQAGTYPDGASPYGVLDMAGNVREWVADWYEAEYYQNSPEQNPGGPLLGGARGLRGGSWNQSTFSFQTTTRDRYDPTLSLNTIGFRCARSP